MSWFFKSGHPENKQGSICETRKGPNRPPIRRGIDYLVYAHVLENPRYWAFLANFRWPKLSKGTPTHQDLSFEPIHMSLRPSVTKIQPCKVIFEKPLFLDILANFGHFRWPKLSKGTSTGQDLSYELIPRSLRPSVTKIQPGKESMTNRRTSRIDRPPTFGVGA